MMEILTKLLIEQFGISTRIFILDSMGGRHMRAAKNLNAWLKCEAKHRLNISDKDLKSARVIHAEV